MEHNKKTKLAIFIGAIAAVISAAVLIIVFWDKLLDLCPRRKKATDLYDYADTPDSFEEPEEEEVPAKESAPSYNEDELNDFADLDVLDDAE